MVFYCKSVKITYIDDYNDLHLGFQIGTGNVSEIAIFDSAIRVRRDECDMNTLIPMNHVTRIDYKEVDE